MTPGAAPTWDEARALGAALAAQFGATVVRKREHAPSLAIAAGLDAARAGAERLRAALVGAGVPPELLPPVPAGLRGDEYLDGWATTYGDVVAMPDVSDPAAWLELLAHELEHVVQWKASHAGRPAEGEPDAVYAMPGGWAFALGYVLGQPGEPASHDELRAKSEAQAEAARVEVHHARTGATPSVDESLAPLCSAAYMLGANGRGVARRILAARTLSARNHGRGSDVARAFVAACEARYPHLLARP